MTEVQEKILTLPIFLANHNKDYSVVKTFWAGELAHFCVCLSVGRACYGLCHFSYISAAGLCVS
ncbi:MAG: hypothetical protein SOX17_00855, partial [Prevotella sp.]|nr:hypothetical protein [Prevotella sp.]